MRRLFLSPILVAFVIHPIYANSELSVQLETGAAWQHRNDVRVNSETGTLFEIDKFDQGPFLHYRAEAFYRFSENHSLRLVYAPLQIRVKGVSEADITYKGEIFLADQELTASISV